MNRASRAVGALLLAAASTAGAAEPESVRSEIEAITQGVDEIERNYLGQAELEQKHKVAARLSDGQFFFATGDFDRAAMVLWDVVEAPGNRYRSHPGYRDALFFLAESLFHTRNFNAARKYFLKTTVEGRPDQQQQAIGRLLVIALLTGDVQAAQQYLAQAGRLLEATPDPRLLYAVGKYHYEVGDLPRAAGYFARVPAGSGPWLKSQYFLAVLDVRANRLNEAIERFRGVVSAPPVEGETSARDDATVRDEARLSVARIYYEQGEFAQAIDAYTSVPREAKAFDDAMYESVWIAIKQGDYVRALRRLEILLISQPDVLRGPDARLLKGKLQMMLERFDDASLAFQEVLFEFGPIQGEMRTIVQHNQGDLAAHFNRLIGRNIADFDLSSFLPDRAAEFAGPDVEADRALLLVGDLAAQRRDVEDARRTVGRLDVALGSGSRIQIFPRLYGGWLRANELSARVTLARARLNEAAASIGANSEDYRALRAERERWAARYAKVPKSSVALQARSAKIGEQMKRLDQEAFKLSLEIRALNAQLTAIDKYVRDSTATTGELTKDTAARAQVVRELAQTGALGAELEVLMEAIEAERIRVGGDDYASQEDERVRGAYKQALDAESAWLAAHGAGGADAERRALDLLDKRLASFGQRVGGIVDDKVKDLQRQLDSERVHVGEYDRELVSYQGETESLGGAIAARSFNAVMLRIDAVVLEADVGLIDVAWKQKKDQSDQIGGMLARQRAEFEELDRSFKEVTRD